MHLLQFTNALMAAVDLSLKVRDAISARLEDVLLELKPVPLLFGAKLRNCDALVGRFAGLHVEERWAQRFRFYFIFLIALGDIVVHVVVESAAAFDLEIFNELELAEDLAREEDFHWVEIAWIADKGGE